MRPSPLPPRRARALRASRAAPLAAPLAAALLALACDDAPTPADPPTGGASVILSCAPGDVAVCGASSCSGVMRCGEDGRWPEAEACIFPEEVCDGFDQDCDGAVDETFITLGDACDYVGPTCAGPGVFKCDRESGDVACLPDGPLSTDAERCDGADNDCDGALDEGFNLGAECAVGVGQCAARGVTVCAPDQERGVCDAAPREPAAELCNALDDDCDGLLDETFDVGGVCSAGRGACAAEGVLACNGSGRGLTCGARPGAPSPEACDEADNDCDGKTDEGLPPETTLTRLDLEAAVTLTLTYDAAGRAATTAALTASGRAFTLTHEYGDGGALAAQRVAGDPANLRVEYTYEGAALVEVSLVSDDDIYGIKTLTYGPGGLLASTRQDGAVAPWERAAVSDYLCEAHEYDDGRLARTDRDVGCDDVVDSVLTYSYDEQGVVQRAAVMGPWGAGEVTYAYDAQGRLTAEVEAVAGHPVRARRSAYTPEGRLSSVALDGGEVGLAVSRRVDRASAAGELLSTRLDDDGDGAPDRVFTYERAGGVITAARLDADGDGDVDIDLAFTYDPQTNLHVSTAATAAGGGPVLGTWTYSYTPEGLLAEESRDEDFDGDVDVVEEYTYDAQGRLAAQATTLTDAGGGERTYTRAFSYVGNAAAPAAAALTGDADAAGLGAGVDAAAYTYDGDRLARVDYSAGPLTLSRDDYAYGCWAE